MKNITILLTFIVVLCSCQKENLFEINDLNSSVSDRNEITVREFRKFVFVKIENDNNHIGMISPDKLHKLYVNCYDKEYDYTTFLYKILNLKISVQSNNLEKNDIFKLNDFMNNEYESGGIAALKKIYTVKKDDKFYLNNKIITPDFWKTILYFFYINKYEYYRNDYTAEEWFVEEDKLKFFNTDE